MPTGTELKSRVENLFINNDSLFRNISCFLTTPNYFSSNFAIFTGFSLLQMDTQALDQSFFLGSTSSSNFPNPRIPTPLCTSIVNPCHYKSFQIILLICFLTFVKMFIEVNLDFLPYITTGFSFTQPSKFFKMQIFHILNLFHALKSSLPQPFLPFHFLLCNTYSNLPF